MSFTRVLGDDRSIYAVAAGGPLLWYCDTLRDGSNGPGAERGWAAASGSPIGSGWAGFRHLFAGGGGILYAVRDTGELLWYRDTARNGASGWPAVRVIAIVRGWE
jgi:hypothetical protein